MFVYVGRTFNVTATGSVRREVRCEKCAQTYYYDMIRTGSGSGSSPYMLNNRGAANRASSAAQQRVGKALQRGSDLVPCPECGWFQSEMIHDARRERHRWLRALGWFVAGTGTVTCGALYFSSLKERGPQSERSPLVLLAVAGGSVAAGVLLLWLRRTLAARFDPNDTFPERRPQPIPGMPPALKALPSPYGREPAIVVADRRQPEIQNGWLTVQMPRVVWPPHCCNCMGQAQTTFRRSFRLSQQDNSLPLPICHRCNKALGRRMWLWAFLAWPLTFGVLLLVVLPLPLGDAFARVAAAMIGTAVLGTILMFALPYRVVRPSRVKVIDRPRAIYRVKFSNPQYAQTVARFYDGAPVEPAFAQPATGGFPVLPVSSDLA